VEGIALPHGGFAAMSTPLLPVLIVEDDESLGRTLSAALRSEVDSTCVDNAEDAMFKLGEKRYSVVVLDVMLRASSGLYVIDFLRSLPEGHRPAVLIVTGAKSQVLANIDRAIVKAIMFKPVDLEPFAALVRVMAVRSTREQLHDSSSGGGPSTSNGKFEVSPETGKETKFLL
jgi:DNA-binding response OmpR family regulator